MNNKIPNTMKVKIEAHILFSYYKNFLSITKSIQNVTVINFFLFANLTEEQ